MRSLDDLTLYVGGLLDPSAQEAMDDHVRACAECQALVRRLEAEHEFLAKALGRTAPDRLVRNRLTEEVIARRRS